MGNIPDDSMTKAGTEFERRIADAYRQMGARTVEHVAQLAGNQIDVYVELEAPDRSLHRIAIEAKDWAKPVGIDVVNSFAAIARLLREKGIIDEGVIVSAKGFSKFARDAARNYDIRLLEPTDLDAMVAKAKEVEPPILQVSEQEYQAALTRYLECVYLSHRRLDLAGIGADYQPVNLKLEEVYVPLLSRRETRLEETWRKELLAQHRYAETRKAGKPIPEEGMSTFALHEALGKYKRLAVIGDPGCGKTTFLRYIALILAKAIREGDDAIATNRLGLEGDLPLPIFLPLREFTIYLKECEGRDRVGDNPVLLVDFIQDFFNRRVRDGMPVGFFSHQLRLQNCILLFDGIDEVADEDERIAISSILDNFVRQYRQNRYVVTSRSRAYRGDVRLEEDFEVCTVQAMNWNQVLEFLCHWSLAMLRCRDEDESEALRDAAQRQAGELLAAIADNPRVRELVDNPLLLTVIAIVYHNKRVLPQQRAELYEECVKILLGQRDRAKEGQAAKQLARYSGLPERSMSISDRRSFLEHVAFRMHELAEEGLEVSRFRVLTWLSERFQKLDDDEPAVARRKAEVLLPVLDVRSGLLQEHRPGHYRFRHQTFQEFLTARYIAEENCGDMVKYTLRHLRDNWWHEVILLEAGYLSLGGESRAARLVEAIANVQATSTQERTLNLVLAAECLLDLEYYRVRATVRKAVIVGLMQLATHPDQPVSVPVRARAGTLLGRLGDPRFFEYAQEPELVEVPKSAFVMGDNGSPYHDEKPEHPVELTLYAIGKYPVINSQYAAFVEAGAYKQKRYWTEEGWLFLTQNGITQPKDWEPADKRPTHPVVGISWYEAMAYCVWLSDQTGKNYRLPTEAQWERAARGINGQAYPWGDVWGDNLSNTSESGIGDTTPVGIYPRGQSPVRALDMLGNTWEWVADWYAEDYYFTAPKSNPLGPDDGTKKVLRGGSWADDPSATRCACRFGYSPRYRSAFVGFRCVRIPEQPATRSQVPLNS